MVTSFISFKYLLDNKVNMMIKKRKLQSWDIRSMFFNDLLNLMRKAIFFNIF